MRRWRAGLAGLLLAMTCAACGASATAPSVAPPTPSPTPAGGTHEFRLAGLPVPVTLELPPGWTADGPVVSRTSEDEATPMSVSVWLVRQVYRDPCNWLGGAVRAGRGTDALADALAGQSGRRSQVSRVSIGEHSALLVTMEVSDEVDVEACDEREFRSWPPDRDRDARVHAGPGEKDELYLVQVGRRTVVIDAAYFDDADSSELAEIHRIVASVTFGDGS
ncbi:MAG TPA: hypothetical protein VH859_01050 [Candidatus Limnocylindria bacterium]|jgi:hypothetical protein